MAGPLNAALAMLRSYHHAHGHLTPRQDAVWHNPDGQPVAIGQLMANLRRTHGLGRNTKAAAMRAEQLTAIDEDWKCPWPLDWQRHHRILAALAADEPGGRLPDIAPGVMYEGDDLGTWIQRQRRNWGERRCHVGWRGGVIFALITLERGEGCPW
ncbi:hypothetical protein [Streptomyces sp. NPDC002671]